MSGQKNISQEVHQAQQSMTALKCQPFKINSLRSKGHLDSHVKEFSLLDLNTSVLMELKSGKWPLLQLSIPQSDRENIVLDLIEADLFSADFTLVQAPLMNRVSYKGVRHYQGIVRGKDNSFAAISILDDEIAGIISLPSESGSWVIGKLNDSQTHILYEDNQLSMPQPDLCHTEDDLKQNYTPEQLRFRKKTVRNNENCLNLYLEVDYDIYQSRESSIVKTVDYITSLMNQVNLLYQNEDIKTRISEIVVWTEPSPYNATTASGMLSVFRTQRPDFNGDMAQLLSYKTSGGVAYVNTLCSPNKSFRTSFSSIHDNFHQIPVYSWSVHVMAHELGHIIGSQHTHACVWNGNNTAIDGCFSPVGACVNPGIPEQGGTVMSYCHANSQGINFSLGFGPQPGNVLRYNVTHADCLESRDAKEDDTSGCREVALMLELKTDAYPSETTWDILNEHNEVVGSGGPYSSRHTVSSTFFCLPEGCYTFRIRDAYGDGICCQYGEGYYKWIFSDDTEIVGPRFTGEGLTSFCLNKPAATCDDGIQNGDEEGVDCGGRCTPCPTCDDGIQNGHETDVDCGGDCPSCDEDNPDVVVDTLAGHYFENGWDEWTRGGLHASRVRSVHAPEGQFCLRLRNGQDSMSSVFSPDFDTQGYASIILSFQYKPVHMEAGKSFNLQVYGREGWQVHKNYISGVAFENNTTYADTLNLAVRDDGPLRLRFEIEGTDNSDLIYLDAFEILALRHDEADTYSCEDGIQNGTETGIDCGGDCPPCGNDEDTTSDEDGGSTDEGEQVVATELAAYYFEESIEGWIRGGVHSSRVFSVHSPEGQYSLRLRNGQETSSSVSSPWMHLSGIDSLRVAFSMKALSFEDDKYMIISYFDGMIWHDLDTLVAGIDFVSQETTQFFYIIPHAFSSEFQWKFSSAGSDNSDLIYLDAVTFTAYHPEHIHPVFQPDNAPLLSYEDSPVPILSPNPADTYLHIQMNETPSLVQVVTLSGLVLWEDKYTHNLDVSALQTGVYIVMIYSDEKIYHLKFVKR